MEKEVRREEGEGVGEKEGEDWRNGGEGVDREEREGKME